MKAEKESILKRTNSEYQSVKFVKLGEYVISIKGKKPKNVVTIKTKNCFLPYVNIRAFEKGIVNEYTDGVGCVICEDGDFLMVWDGSRSGYVGRGIKGALGSTLVKLNFPEIDNDYAYYFLQSKYIEINTRAKGVGIPHVDPNLLWNYELRIPSAKEQQTIVSKIEELFSELDKGIESLKTALEQLKIYRQSVLKWAFEGRLTNDNVKDGELPKGWEWSKLGDYIENIGAGKSFRCDERPPKENEMGIIKVSAVTWGNYDETESKTCFSNDLFNENYSIKVGDFLFSRANTLEFIGACVIVHKVERKLMLSDKILRFKFSNKVSKEYVLYYLRSFKGRKQIEILSTGNQDSMRNIGQEKIKQIEFPICSISDQKKVVKAIENRIDEADTMEANINQCLLQSEAMRQSILKMAFEGRLV